MRAKIIITLGALLLSQASSSAVNAVVTIASIEKDRGFTHIWALQDDRAGVTSFTIDIDPKKFSDGCNYRGVFGAPASFTVSLCPNNTDSFKGVTAEIGSFKIDDKELRLRFQVPTPDLSHYHLEFQGFTESDGSIPRFGNGLYIASLPAIRHAKSAITEADLNIVVEEASEEEIGRSGFGTSSEQQPRPNKSEHRTPDQP